MCEPFASFCGLCMNGFKKTMMLSEFGRSGRPFGHVFFCELFCRQFKCISFDDWFYRQYGRFNQLRLSAAKNPMQHFRRPTSLVVQQCDDHFRVSVMGYEVECELVMAGLLVNPLECETVVSIRYACWPRQAYFVIGQFLFQRFKSHTVRRFVRCCVLACARRAFPSLSWPAPDFPRRARSRQVCQTGWWLPRWLWRRLPDCRI